MPRPSIQAFLLISLLPSLATARRTTPSHETWAKSHNTERDTITTLTFYFHDMLGGKNATALAVAQANTTNKSPTAFGLMVIADEPLTEKPDRNSKLIGRAQGMYASASNQEFGLLMAFTFEFTDGIYNGSSFSLLGRNPISHATREMPVVGGTGLFRWASGFAVARTYKFDAPAAIAIVGYNVTLLVPNALKNFP